MATFTDNTYRFATTEDDPYIQRVVAEAAPETNFILINEKNTVLGPGTSAYLLVRERVLALALVAGELPLAGKTLGELLEDFANGPEGDVKKNMQDFFAIVISGEPSDVREELSYIRGEIRDITKVIETVKTQGRRLENVLKGRTVRVNVESF